LPGLAKAMVLACLFGILGGEGISVQVASVLICLTRHSHICQHLHTTRELMMPLADSICGQNMQDPGQVAHTSLHIR